MGKRYCNNCNTSHEAPTGKNCNIMATANSLVENLVGKEEDEEEDIGGAGNEGINGGSVCGKTGSDSKSSGMSKAQSKQSHSKVKKPDETWDDIFGNPPGFSEIPESMADDLEDDDKARSFFLSMVKNQNIIGRQQVETDKKLGKLTGLLKDVLKSKKSDNRHRHNRSRSSSSRRRHPRGRSSSRKKSSRRGRSKLRSSSDSSRSPSSDSSTDSNRSSSRSSSSSSSSSRSRSPSRRRKRRSKKSKSSKPSGKYSYDCYLSSEQRKTKLSLPTLWMCMSSLLVRLCKKGVNVKGFAEHMLFVATKASDDNYKVEALVKYDQEVRRKAKKKGLKAFRAVDSSLKDQYLGSDTLKPKTSSSKTKPSSNNKKQSLSYCMHYNAGNCTADRCKYPHVCSFCFKNGHRVENCFAIINKGQQQASQTPSSKS